MAVSFDTIPFDVLVEDGTLPYPTSDESGVRYYEVTAIVRNAGRITSLQARLSIVTILPAIGAVGGGIAVVEAGRGSKPLIYPMPDGTEVTVAAILTALRPTGRFGNTAAWTVEMTFLVLGEAT